jgi:hypothetical protein
MSPAVSLRASHARDVQSLQGARGRVSVWQVAPGVYASEVTGHLDVKMAQRIIDFAEPLYALGSVAGFHDWFEMTGYESRSRIALTQWVLGHRAKSRLFIGVRSKLVAMGVSVANLALGDLIEVHASLATLEEALDGVLREGNENAPARR